MYGSVNVATTMRIFPKRRLFYAFRAGLVAYLSVLFVVNLLAFPALSAVQDFWHSHSAETPWHVHDLKPLFSSLVVLDQVPSHVYLAFGLDLEEQPGCYYALVLSRFLARAPPQSP